MTNEDVKQEESHNEDTGQKNPGKHHGKCKTFTDDSLGDFDATFPSKSIIFFFDVSVDVLEPPESLATFLF